MSATNVDPNAIETPVPVPGRIGIRLPNSLREVWNYVWTIGLALVLFGILLALLGKDPIRAYTAIYDGALRDSYGWSEVVVKMIPFILTALAVAIPARLGLINVGGEGQIYIGAVFASFVALKFGALPPVILIPLLVAAGALGGALWGGVVGLTRAVVGLNETISSLLLNYLAILMVDMLVHGPWKDPGGPNWAYTAEFPVNAHLATFGGSRISLGIVFALVSVAVYFWLFRYTRWGYKMRVVGGNAEAASRSGIRVNWYVIGALMLGAAFAGIAGMVEVTAIQWRLRAGISNGYGYIGFLVAWLAIQKPGRIIVMAAIVSIVSVGGDMLQIGAGLPSSTVNILMAFILFLVLRNQGLTSAKETS
ncbi:MAG: ABC transporter permease [Anaerolineaceae bacterium]|nr:ABC transporter permease [Anaerolineaceae bacterium]